MCSGALREEVGGGDTVPGMGGTYVGRVSASDLPWDCRRDPSYLTGLSWLKNRATGGWAERILGRLGIVQPDQPAVRHINSVSTTAEFVLCTSCAGETD